ncbi:uncharacterized protein MEPE_03193 [Melanopsichium pennsylvanicum]|uniref:Uncharacterized protein n=2 Tax=Melanopsichium pennsylvanicum TaxID=63383 RepID=A0AAJ4XLD1_9BASI|nr:hypothetical protein BN887_01329 [Melanopsichium pennsylvanicum 4]SNX84484.1 uncharacterized protein MEPE_03193 [Melanopsichium pennsylvanicum]
MSSSQALFAGSLANAAAPESITVRTHQNHPNTTTVSASTESNKGHHRRTSSLLSLPSLNSLGSFLTNAATGSLTNTISSEAQAQASVLPSNSRGTMSTDAELIISNPDPTEWADDMSPINARVGWSNEGGTSTFAQVQGNKGPRDLGEEVRFRGQSKRTENLGDSKNFIAFPTQATSTMPASEQEEPATPRRPALASRTSSATSSEDYPARLLHSPEPTTSSSHTSSADTPATSVKYSPASTAKKIPEVSEKSPLLPPSPPPPSETTTVKATTSTQHHSQPQTLPRSFATSRSPAFFSKALREQTATPHGRTSSLSAATGRDHVKALSSAEKTVERQAGFRARSINSIRGLAAAWVPARFAPTSQPSSSVSSSGSSNDDNFSLDVHSPRRRDGLALAPGTGARSKELVKHGDNSVKRPVKLDRRRLDKAVSLAVEAAQAAEEDEKMWEEKRAKKVAAVARRPSLQAAWSNTSRNSIGENRQMTRFARHPDASAGLKSEEEQSDDDDDDLGFSLDLYISSLGYLISAISDKEAPGLSNKQRQEIKQRLDEGMSKLGFDATAELAKAEAIKRELELEREKLQIQQASHAANVVHHHYHTAVPANSGIFGGGDFSRAHAAAKASSRGSSSFAGKISTSVLDIGLHIGAGALSALSANLGAIAPRRPSTESVKGNKVMEDSKITDLDNDEDLESMDGEGGEASPRMSASQPGSGAATPRTAWTRAINQNNKQWELAVAFASTAASALASSLGAVARSEHIPPAPTSSVATSLASTSGSLTPEEQQQLDTRGHFNPTPEARDSAEERLILLSASLARALKRSPLPAQLYALLRQLVSILAAIDAKYSLTEKGAQLAVRETSRALRFVRRHDLHVKAVRVAWAAAEAAVAALEAYRDEKGWHEMQNWRIEGSTTTPTGSPMFEAKEKMAIESEGSSAS